MSRWTDRLCFVAGAVVVGLVFCEWAGRRYMWLAA